MKRILTVGVFDLLHFGHMELFRKAKALGDHLIVAVQDDENVVKFKPGTKLTYNTEQRCYMVASIRYVDEVVVYKNAESIVQEVDFDVFARGQTRQIPVSKLPKNGARLTRKKSSFFRAQKAFLHP